MRIKTLFVAICLLGLMVWSPPSAAVDAEPEGPGDVAEPSDPGDTSEEVLDEIAAQTLVDLYGVTLEDARQQMAIQPAARRATEALTAQIPEESQGGFHIDRLDGGALVVSVTDPTVVGSVDGLGLPIVVRTVEHTTGELRAIQQEILAQLSEVPELSPIVHVETNTVRLRPFATAGDAATTLAERFVATYGDAVSIGETFPAPPVPTACHPNHQYCEAPLRGGVAVIGTPMHGSNFTDVCTSAFFVRSNTDNRSFLMSAGHCRTGSTRRAKQYPSNTIHDIGDVHSSRFDSGADAAIIAIDNIGGWDSRAWVLVRDSNWTLGDGGYDINGLGTTGGLPASYLLCTTGAVSDTRCGPLTATGVPGATIANAAEVIFSSCGGDSGGPVYKEHKGFGLVNATIAVTFPTVYIGMGSSFPTQCGVVSYYQGLAGALSAMNVYLP